MQIHRLRWSVRQSLAMMLALALGIALHDLFRWFPSIVTEFFAPVNESIWEHVKLIYWPLLITLPLGDEKLEKSSRLAFPLFSSVLMLLLAWLYHVRCGGESMAVDIIIFAAVIGLAFLLSACISIPQNMTGMICILSFLWVVLLLAFTLNPPDGVLFRDASLVDAWVRMVC